MSIFVFFFLATPNDNLQINHQSNFMQVKKLPYSEVPLFSTRDKAYILENPGLRPFYKYPVNLESFRQVIADKANDNVDRETLAEVLLRQHEGLDAPPSVLDNINKLRDKNTFTVATAHQPSLFTGPLYYIFKIISALNLAEKLNENYPDFHFVPVFISSGEDHDFAEVNHLHLFNKTLTWESGETGPVGQMDTSSLQPVLEELKAILGESENAKTIYGIIEKTHSKPGHYARAAYELAHELFKKDGLVVLNTNDGQLKKAFVPFIKEEIFGQVSKPLVEATCAELEKAGYHAQAMPREINFFYLKNNIRERIVLEEGVYKVLNTSLAFSQLELEAEIDNHPERFSPNVIMRPIYQELTLPNLAYIGGGGRDRLLAGTKGPVCTFQPQFPHAGAAGFCDVDRWRCIEENEKSQPRTGRPLERH